MVRRRELVHFIYIDVTYLKRETRTSSCFKIVKYTNPTVLDRELVKDHFIDRELKDNDVINSTPCYSYAYVSHVF